MQCSPRVCLMPEPWHRYRAGLQQTVQNPSPPNLDTGIVSSHHHHHHEKEQQLRVPL